MLFVEHQVVAGSGMTPILTVKNLATVYNHKLRHKAGTGIAGIDNLNFL